MLNGAKRFIANPSRLCKNGDRFEAFGAIFRVWYVTDARLDLVGRFLYADLGYRSQSEFLDRWDQEHPTHRKRTGQIYIHHIALVAGIAPHPLVTDLAAYRAEQQEASQ